MKIKTKYEKMITPEDFPYDEYLSVKDERDKFIGEWLDGLKPYDYPVIIIPTWDMWNDNSCAKGEVFLQKNLWGMAVSADWKSDHVFPHLQPWYGVGLYATAFGSPYFWNGAHCPQTQPIFKSVDELKDMETPDPEKCENMKVVLDRIAWYRKVTKDRLPICLTDTQSPNDTASLLMETNEYFLNISLQPENLGPLFRAIAELIIAFSDMQIGVAGPTISLPGHQMLCHPKLVGISVSDDNMVMLSPRTYEEAVVPYNSMLGEYFGGVAVHSCGQIGHNVSAVLKTKNINQAEHAICIIEKDSDYDPSPPEPLRDGFKGTDVILKVRINKNEVDLLDRFLDPGLRCVLHVTGVETKEESVKVYQAFKRKIATMSEKWAKNLSTCA